MDREIKICGTTSTWDLETAARYGADAVGVICDYNERGNTVTNHRADWFVRCLPDNVTSVLVPRITEADKLVDLAQRVHPDRIQLGENEDPRLAEALRKLEDRPTVAQVIHVSDTTKPDRISDFLDFVDYIHLDTYHPDRPGGTGHTHNWEVSADIATATHEAGRLVLLAGGLTPDNVQEAIETVQPDGVDVESGIKDMFGSHDPVLIQDFVRNARTAFQALEVLS